MQPAKEGNSELTDPKVIFNSIKKFKETKDFEGSLTTIAEAYEKIYTSETIVY